MLVELTGGIVLGVLLAVVSQVVDYVSANSRMFAAKMNEVRRSTAHGPVYGSGGHDCRARDVMGRCRRAIVVVMPGCVIVPRGRCGST